MAMATIAKGHQVSVLGRDVSCNCGLSGHAQGGDTAALRRIGHAHVANPGVPFDALIEFVMRGAQ